MNVGQSSRFSRLTSSDRGCPEGLILFSKLSTRPNVMIVRIVDATATQKKGPHTLIAIPIAARVVTKLLSRRR